MAKSPTDILRHEHEVVLLVVEAIEHEVTQIKRTGHVDRDRVADMIDFTRNFTDGCHHAKEEKALFPLLERVDPSSGGPVSVMLSEHDAGRETIRAIDEALPDVATSEAARIEVGKNLAAYAHLLRLHIHKEDKVLFPLADEVLGDEAKHDLAAEFERIEAEETGAGLHERYHALAHRLSQSQAA